MYLTIFKKRTINTHFSREKTWLNVSESENLSSRLRLSHFSEVECLPGKNHFKVMLSDEWTFHLMRSGEQLLFIPGTRSFQLTPSDVYMFHPRDDKKERPKEYVENLTKTPFKRYYFAIDRNVYMEQMFCLNELGYIHLKDPTALFECVEQISTLVKQQDGCSMDDLSILLFRFLTLLTAEHRENNTSGSYEQLIKKIKYYPQNYPTLQSLQKVFAVSRCTLQKIFQEYTGKSPIDFVVYCRLNNSCWMLTNSELPIREIAILNGYSSAAFYTKAFKKVVGVTPSQYRKARKHYFPDVIPKKI